MKSRPGVYCIENKITRERYIGSSRNCRERMWDHFSRLKKGNHVNVIMQASFKWFPERYWKVYALSYCPVEYLYVMEDWFIKSTLPEFNINFDARGGVNTPAHTEKLRNLRLEEAKNPENHKNFRRSRMKPIVQMDMSGRVIANFESASEAARTLECSTGAIDQCARGKTKTSRGYKWSYIQNV